VTTEDGTCWVYKELEQGKWNLSNVTNSEGYIEEAESTK
jgi:hypothetical protein